MPPAFSAKTAPTDDKLRGGYYTPDAVAQFLARWVGEGGGRLLEPSCGDGAVLRHLAAGPSSLTVGIERLPSEAQKAKSHPGSHVIASDFFHWFLESQHGQWDGVAGNPPYIRFGHWPEEDRKEAMRLMSNAGLKPSRLTNAWVPFTVASVLALRPGGRVGLVLPAELLQVGYARQLREFLLENLSTVRVVTFRQLLFKGVLQEVVLLLGERGVGPANFATVEIDSAEELGGLELPPAEAPSHLYEKEKWTKYFLSAEQVGSIRSVREGGGLTRLGDLADVDVGVVTGRNSFFTLTDEDARRLGVLPYCVPLASKSAQLSGTRFTNDDFEALRANGGRCWLLALDSEVEHSEALQEYVAAGVAAEVHTGYKCRIRKQWWSVPSIWVPDAFMLRQVTSYPKVIVNESGATSTDTVHRVRFTGQFDCTGAQLSTAVLNSATFAMAEVLGRSYGGGVLELEPTEAEDLLIPPPDLIPDHLCSSVDDLVREGDIEAAATLVDQVVLRDKLGWDPDLIEAMRSSWVLLRDRRQNRGRKSKAGTTAA